MTTSPSPLSPPEPNPTRVGVAVYLIDSEGRVLLMHRTSKHGNDTWAPPGGHIEFAEDPVQTAVRETVEEIGITLDTTHIQFIGYTNDVFHETSKHYITLYMVARVNDPSLIRNMEPHKCSEIKWIYPRDWPMNLFTPVQNFVDKFGGPDGVAALFDRVLSQNKS